MQANGGLIAAGDFARFAAKVGQPCSQVSQDWRAGYTCADGTKVKGHDVKKKTSLIERIVDAIT